MNKPYNHYIIAIDGTAASGKGTLAKKLAEHLNFTYLDTGRLYRAVAYNFSKNNDIKQAIANISSVDLDLELLASSKIGNLAAELSSKPIVRKGLKQYQIDFALKVPKNKKGAILDGRDITTVICPNADIKIYIDADVRVRAKRRYDTLSITDKNCTYEKTLSDLQKRDKIDKNKKISPLIIAKDAFLLDTSSINVDKAIDVLLTYIKANINID